MTSHIVHQPILGQFQSIYCRKNIKVVEQHFLNTHLNMFLLQSIIADIQKTICMRIIINKQNNNDKFKFKKYFLLQQSIIIPFISCRRSPKCAANTGVGVSMRTHCLQNAPTVQHLT